MHLSPHTHRTQKRKNNLVNWSDASNPRPIIKTQDQRDSNSMAPAERHREDAEYPGQAEECYDSSLQRQNHDYVSTNTKPLTWPRSVKSGLADFSLPHCLIGRNKRMMGDLQLRAAGSKVNLKLQDHKHNQICRKMPFPYILSAQLCVLYKAVSQLDEVQIKLLYASISPHCP